MTHPRHCPHETMKYLAKMQRKYNDIDARSVLRVKKSRRFRKVRTKP